MTTLPHMEWYSIHVPAGLPECVARAANERNMTPGEFVAHAVNQALSRGLPRRRISPSDLGHEIELQPLARV